MRFEIATPPIAFSRCSMSYATGIVAGGPPKGVSERRRGPLRSPQPDGPRLLMIELGPNTALVVIDLMHRIVALPLEPRSGARVVEATALLGAEFRSTGAPVILVRTERPGVAEQPPGSDLVPELATAGEVIVKKSVGAFH